MRIELEITERLVRKIRTLNMLLGGHHENFEGFLSQLLDNAVSSAIIGELGLLEGPAEQEPRSYETRPDDASGISDGLGDEEDSEPPAPVRSMTDVIPRRGGLTDQVLDDDMMVADPEHEAKADAASFEADILSDTAESLFADLAGLPAPEVRKKKSPVKLRGRVTPFNGHEESTI